MSQGYTASTLANLLGARAWGGPDLGVTDVVRDSRALARGVLFCAIRGAHVEGHDYLRTLPDGALALVQDREDEVPPGCAWIKVADTREAMAIAADHVHGGPSRALDVVGVTGTNGKTTTTWLIARVCEVMGVVAGQIGTLGARIAGVDVPCTLTTPEAVDLQRLMASLRDQAGRVCAIEVSSVGLVTHRVDGVELFLGIFTNLSRDHLDFHGTMEAYAAAKAQIFHHLKPPRADGLPRALLCRDDPAWTRMAPAGAIWTYGFDPASDVQILAWRPGLHASVLELCAPGFGTHRIESPLLGRYNAQNLAAAWAAGLLLGLDPKALSHAFTRVEGPPGRMERVSDPAGRLCVVDYAHTPDAVVSVLMALRDAVPGRLVVVLGCGGDRDRGKRPVMTRRAAQVADDVILTSDNPRSEDPDDILRDMLEGDDGRARVIVDRREAIAYAVALTGEGDGVVVLGKGHETYQEALGRREPFDDREVLRRALEGL